MNYTEWRERESERRRDHTIRMKKLWAYMPWRTLYDEAKEPATRDFWVTLTLEEQKSYLEAMGPERSHKFQEKIKQEEEYSASELLDIYDALPRSPREVPSGVKEAREVEMMCEEQSPELLPMPVTDFFLKMSDEEAEDNLGVHELHVQVEREPDIPEEWAERSESRTILHCVMRKVPGYKDGIPTVLSVRTHAYYYTDQQCEEAACWCHRQDDEMEGVWESTSVILQGKPIFIWKKGKYATFNLRAIHADRSVFDSLEIHVLSAINCSKRVLGQKVLVKNSYGNMIPPHVTPRIQPLVKERVLSVALRLNFDTKGHSGMFHQDVKHVHEWRRRGTELALCLKDKGIPPDIYKRIAIEMEFFSVTGYRIGVKQYPVGKVTFWDVKNNALEKVSAFRKTGFLAVATQGISGGGYIRTCGRKCRKHHGWRLDRDPSYTQVPHRRRVTNTGDTWYMRTPCTAACWRNWGSRTVCELVLANCHERGGWKVIPIQLED